MCFALHLAEHRRTHDPDPIAPCVTAVDPPQLPADGRLVRLPHLLTVRDAIGALTDTAVWEVMTTDQAIRWLGSRLPDEARIEANLTDLLHLRRDARAGQYPPSPAGQRLRELLTDRYLSLRLVYRHPDLFNALLPPSTRVPGEPR